MGRAQLADGTPQHGIITCIWFIFFLFMYYWMEHNWTIPNKINGEGFEVERLAVRGRNQQVVVQQPVSAPRHCGPSTCCTHFLGLNLFTLYHSLFLSNGNLVSLYSWACEYFAIIWFNNRIIRQKKKISTGKHGTSLNVFILRILVKIKKENGWQNPKLWLLRRVDGKTTIQEKITRKFLSVASNYLRGFGQTSKMKCRNFPLQSTMLLITVNFYLGQSKFSLHVSCAGVNTVATVL